MRPTQVESLGGSLAFLADRTGLVDVTTRTTYGSKNVFGSGVWLIAVACALALAAALVLTWHRFAKSDRSYPRLAAATLASVAAFVAFGKVLSPRVPDLADPSLAPGSRTTERNRDLRTPHGRSR